MEGGGARGVNTGKNKKSVKPIQLPFDFLFLLFPPNPKSDREAIRTERLINCCELSLSSDKILYSSSSIFCFSPFSIAYSVSPSKEKEEKDQRNLVKSTKVKKSPKR